MGKIGSCRICIIGRYCHEPEKDKWWRNWHVCYECAGILDLLVQRLVPVSERK